MTDTNPQTYHLDDEMNDILLSGGAIGADSCWTIAAINNNHEVLNFVFDGYSSKCQSSTFVYLTDNELGESYEALVKSNSTLNRSVPSPSSYVYKLLARSRYQILDAESMYCVGSLNKNAHIYGVFDQDYQIDGIDVLGVNGGTSWAVQMFSDRKSCGIVHFYDQGTNRILYNIPGRFSGWKYIGYIDMLNNQIINDSDFLFSSPSGTYAGIGTRDINEAGKAFIRMVYTMK